jgi:signal transduction histidine kinase
MYRVLVTLELESHRDELARLHTMREDEWIVFGAQDMAEALAMLGRGAWDLFLVSFAALGAEPARALAALREGAGQAACFVVLDAASMRHESRLLQWGAHDVLCWPDPTLDLHHLDTLRVRLERHRQLHNAQHYASRERLEREHLQALVDFQLTAPDFGDLLHFAVQLFRDRGRAGAAAFLKLDEQGQLHVVHQAAQDRLLVCLPPAQHPTWSNLIEHKTPVRFTQRPAPGLFPGLEALWHRLRSGHVTLIPLSGARFGPIGVLVVAELQLPRGADPIFSSSGLELIGRMLTSTLEFRVLYAEARGAYETLRLTQDQLVHAEKFAAVGHLSAQLAHEINNPASFVVSNLSVMSEYVDTIWRCFEQIQQASAARSPELSASILAMMREHEVDFLREDLHSLLQRSLVGMQRIYQVAQDLRYFAHDSNPEASWVDVPAVIEASLSLIRHEIKYRAHLVRQFDAIPQIFSDANKLSQVLLNLLVNASQALEAGDPSNDEIRVTASATETHVIITIEDTGCGMTPEVLEHAFDAFFTTKARGQGTGLGLSISRQLLTSLGGTVEASSQPEQGSCFAVTIPIRAEVFVRQDAHLRESGHYNTPPQLATLPLSSRTRAADD